MSLSFNQSVLVESPSLRTSALSNLDDQRATEVLNKAKAIVFAVWNGSGWATTAQIAEYFSVTESAVKELTRVNQSEFQSLETTTLTGKDLRDARQMLCLPSRTSQVRVFSALGALRIAMILQQSQVAAQVRTIILDLVAAVPCITAQTHSPAPALPPVEQRLQTLVEAMKTLAQLTGGRLNPYMEQHFQDFAANLLAQHNQQALSGSKEKWMGVVNFAESKLGKKVPLSGSHYRGHLGTWVRTFYPQLGERQEMRLVNGTQQPVYVYTCHDPIVADGLTKAIEEFFAHPNPTAALRIAGAFTTKKPRVLVIDLPVGASKGVDDFIVAKGQPVNSVRQMLARLRERVNRHIWSKRVGDVGCGEWLYIYRRIAQKSTRCNTSEHCAVIGGGQ